MNLTIADIQQFKPLSSYATNIANYIKEAENFDLKPLMGEAFFYHFKTAVTTENTLLFNGGTYTDSQGNTVQFSGIKAVLSYFAYARSVAQNSIQDTPFGQKQLQAEWAIPPSQKAIDYKINQIKSGAISYWHEVENFLNVKHMDYPLWKNKCETKKITAQKIRKI